MKIKLHFGNINHTNDAAYREIVANAGYAGSIERVNDCHAILDIGDDVDRSVCGITELEVKVMVAEIILHTSVTVCAEVY